MTQLLSGANDNIPSDYRPVADVCICTFRRTHVTKTIDSIAQLVTPRHSPIHIIVVDNDEQDSARTLVQAAAHSLGIDLTYIHAPAGNISVARNACLDAAHAPLLAFIDDDELVTSNWLNAMLSELRHNDADVVLGPVHAVYDREYPAWIHKGDFHSTRPVFVGDEIMTGYSGNVLFKRLSPYVRNLRFREDLGRSGGEDTAFFSAIHKAGGKITYASDAIAVEPVAPERATLHWLFKRFFRYGTTHGAMLLEQQGKAWKRRLQNAFKASAKAVFCFGMAFLNILRAERRIYWLLRGTMHTGVAFTVL